MLRSCSKMFEYPRRTFCWVLGEDSRLPRLVADEQFQHSKVGNFWLLFLVTWYNRRKLVLVTFAGSLGSRSYSSLHASDRSGREIPGTHDWQGKLLYPASTQNWNLTSTLTLPNLHTKLKLFYCSVTHNRVFFFVTRSGAGWLLANHWLNKEPFYKT